MGNAPSAAPRATRRGGGKQRSQGNGLPAKWAWEYRNGRHQPKPIVAGGSAPKLKWAKKRSDNHDWWIFNPDRKSNDEWPWPFSRSVTRKSSSRAD